MDEPTPTSRHWHTQAPNLAAEGDVNLSPLRRAWEAEHVHGETRKLLDADSAHFLHQSLSTPCLNAVAACEGIWLTDVEGRRIMDFHGNSVHQVGYRHPHVIEAIKQQLDTLPFSPRRYTNAAAVELAAKLSSLAPDPSTTIAFATPATVMGRCSSSTKYRSAWGAPGLCSPSRTTASCRTWSFSAKVSAAVCFQSPH